MVIPFDTIVKRILTIDACREYVKANHPTDLANFMRFSLLNSTTCPFARGAIRHMFMEEYQKAEDKSAFLMVVEEGHWPPG